MAPGLYGCFIFGKGPGFRLYGFVPNDLFS